MTDQPDCTPAMHAPALTLAPPPSRPLAGGGVARRPARAASLALPLLVAVLQGCASAPPVAEKAVATPAAKDARPVSKTVITPQLQAQLDAAMALVKAEQYEQSVEAFKRLAAAVPDNAIPPTDLALVYEKLGKLDLAEAQLKQALELEPANPVASNELALLYRKTGRFAEARPVYEQLLAKYPNFTLAHKNLAVLCDLYLKDYACAISHYRMYSQNAPEDKNVQIWIADLQARSGKKEQP